MEIYHYPQDYLKQRGNIKHSREVHKKVMQELNLPYVTYETFTSRVGRLKWDLYRAIHTPAKTVMRREKTKWEIVKEAFKSLFK